MATRKFPGSCLIKVNKSLVLGVKYISTVLVKFIEWLLCAKNYISGIYALCHLILRIDGTYCFHLQTRKPGSERVSKAKIKQPINKRLPDFKAGAFRHYSVNYIFKKQTLLYKFFRFKHNEVASREVSYIPPAPNMQDPPPLSTSKLLSAYKQLGNI